jgi:3-dehydroquinate dehydratase
MTMLGTRLTSRVGTKAQKSLNFSIRVLGKRKSINRTYRQTRFEAMVVISWFSSGAQKARQVDDY